MDRPGERRAVHAGARVGAGDAPLVERPLEVGPGDGRHVEFLAQRAADLADHDRPVRRVDREAERVAQAPQPHEPRVGVGVGDERVVGGRDERARRRSPGPRRQVRDVEAQDLAQQVAERLRAAHGVVTEARVEHPVGAEAQRAAVVELGLVRGVGDHVIAAGGVARERAGAGEGEVTGHGEAGDADRRHRADGVLDVDVRSRRPAGVHRDAEQPLLPVVRIHVGHGEDRIAGRQRPVRDESHAAGGALDDEQPAVGEERHPDRLREPGDDGHVHEVGRDQVLGAGRGRRGEREDEDEGARGVDGGGGAHVGSPRGGVGDATMVRPLPDTVKGGSDRAGRGRRGPAHIPLGRAGVRPHTAAPCVQDCRSAC